MSNKIQMISDRTMFYPDREHDYEKTNLLCSSIKNNNICVVKEILEKQMNINTCDEYGFYPLHYACKYNQLEIVKYLLTIGANINLTDKNERTPIFYLTHLRNTKIAELLINTPEILVKNDKFNRTIHYYSFVFSSQTHNYIRKMYKKFKIKEPFITKMCAMEYKKYLDIEKKYFNGDILSLTEDNIIRIGVLSEDNYVLRFLISFIIEPLVTDENGLTYFQRFLLSFTSNDNLSNDKCDFIVAHLINANDNLNVLTNDGLSLSKITIKNGLPIVILHQLYNSNNFQPIQDRNQMTDFHYTIKYKQLKHFDWFIRYFNHQQISEIENNRVDLDGNNCLHLIVIYIDDEQKTDSKLFIDKIVENSPNLLVVRNNKGQTPKDLAVELFKPNMADYFFYLLTNSMEFQRKKISHIHHDQNPREKQKAKDIYLKTQRNISWNKLNDNLPIKINLIPEPTTTLYCQKRATEERSEQSKFKLTLIQLYDEYFWNSLLINKIDLLNSQQFPDLHKAVILGSVTEVYNLIKTVNINEKDNEGRTPLHLACQFDQIDILNILIKAGAKYLIKDKYNRSIFHYASHLQNTTIMEYLLKVENNYLYSKDTFERLTIHYARCFSKDSYEFLLTGFKSAANYKEIKKVTSNYYHQFQVMEEFQKFLLFKSYDLTIAQDIIIKEACLYGDTTVMEIITDIAVDCNKKNDKGLTLLQSVLTNFGEPFLEQIQNDLSNRKVKSEAKPIRYMANLLIKMEFNTNILTDEGQNIYHLMAIHGCPKMFEEFVNSLSLDPNLYDCYNKTPMHYLIQFNRGILFDGDIFLEDGDGNTCLHLSAIYNNDTGERNGNFNWLLIKTVKLNLLKTNRNGRTAFHIACELGKIEMAKRFLRYFSLSDLMLEDNTGKNPLDLAAKNYHFEIVRLLFQYDIPVGNEQVSDLIKILLDSNGFYEHQSKPHLSKFYDTFLNNKSDSLEETFRDNTDMLRQIFEEFTVRKIPVNFEFEFNAQKHLLDFDLVVTERELIPKIKSITDDSQIVKEIKDEIRLVAGQCKKIVEDYKENEVDVQLLHSIELIAKSVHLLKKKINIDLMLPWKEFEYVLVAFLTIYAKSQSSSDLIVFKLTLTKSEVLQHLLTFGNELEKCEDIITVDLQRQKKGAKMKQSSVKSELENILKSLKAKDISPDIINKTVENVTKCLELLKKSSEDIRENTFRLLLDDFETTRTFYSLSKILLYVSEGAAIDMKGNELSVLVIQRTIQVFGEYIKNTKDTPNVSDKIQNALTTHTKYLKECLTAIRNDLSHSEYMKTTLTTEKNIDLFINIQNDLRHLRPLFINILYDERETCIRSFIRRMLNAISQEEVNDISFHLSDREQTPINASLNKIKILFEELKDILKHRTNEEEVIFQKMDRILHDKPNLADDEIKFSFFNPEIFLLNAADKTSQTQTKTFLRSNPLSRNDQEPFQLIAYFILQVQKLTEIRLFPSDPTFTQKFQFYCTEILMTCLIGVKQRIHLKIDNQQKEEFQKKLSYQIDEQLEELEGTIKDYALRSEFKTKLDEKKKIHQILKKIKGSVDVSEIDKLFLELTTLNRIFTTKVKLKYNKEFLEITIKETDSYKKLQDSCFKIKTIDSLAMQKFLESFESLKENRSQELRACFTDRINQLRTLLLTNIDYKNVTNLKALKANFPLKIGVELIVLNLFEILLNLNMLSTDREYLEDYAPLLSAKHLRNYLAHGDALFDILPFDTQISVVLNGLKLIHLVDEKKLDILSKNQVVSLPETVNAYNLALRTNESNYWIQEQKNVVEQITDCSVGLNVCLFFMIFILRGRDLCDQTIFNIVFDKHPFKIIDFFAYECPNPDPETQQELSAYLDNSKMPQYLMDPKVLKQNLVNQLFAGSKSKNELIIRLIKICALKGFKQKIDELCILDDEFSFEISLKRKYNTLMDLADKYSFVDSLQQFSKVHIPEYDTQFSIFQLAAAFGHTNVIRRLINNGQDVNAMINKKLTALHISIQSGWPEVVKFLIDNGANLQLNTLDGRSILHFAAASGKVEIIEMILYSNPNIEINAKTKKDETPLHLAARLGHSDVIKFLINKGADIQAETIDGEKIINLISLNGNTSITKMMLEKLRKNIKLY